MVSERWSWDLNPDLLQSGVVLFFLFPELLEGSLKSELCLFITPPPTFSSVFYFGWMLGKQ